MTKERLRCPHCTTPIREIELNQRRLSQCSGCNNLVQAEIFPAYFRETAPGQEGELLLVEGESACFYHPTKKAVIPCSACGRFLCSLCDCDLKGEHFCGPCLETGKRKGKIKSIENSRVRYDSMALILATLPLLVFYVTFITAPAALSIALRRWSAPRSIVEPSRARFVVAIAFASLQVIGWAIGLLLLIVGMNG